jgi:hypothetical protein
VLATATGCLSTPKSGQGGHFTQTGSPPAGCMLLADLN